MTTYIQRQSYKKKLEQNISLITQVICSVKSCSFKKARPFANNIMRSGSVVGRHRTSKIELQRL